MSKHNFCSYFSQVVGDIRVKKPYLTLSAIAKGAGIHASYLSSVLKGKAILQSDQAYLLAETLELGPDARDYFILLNEKHRSQLPARKAKLDTELDRLFEKLNRLGSHLEAENIGPRQDDLVRYFLNPKMMLLHLYLGIEGAQIEKFSAALALSKAETRSLIDELMALELIEATAGSYRVRRHHLHLDKESPWCDAHQKLVHDLGRVRQERVDPKEQQRFCVSFSADSESYAALQKALLKFMGEAERIVTKSPKANLYQLNVDLFPWL